MIKQIVAYLIIGIVVFLIKTLICNYLIGKDLLGLYYRNFSFEDDGETSRISGTMLNILVPTFSITIIYYVVAGFRVFSWINCEAFWCLAIVYYFIRIILIIVQGKGFCIDKKWEIQMFTISIILSIVLYYFYYIKQANLMISSKELVIIMWTGIIAFAYKIFKKMLEEATSITDEGKTREKYVKEKSEQLIGKYDAVVKKVLSKEYVYYAPYVYSIMILENLNRNIVLRKLENIVFYIRTFFSKTTMTLGIMQVTTDEFINDEESVVKGIKLLRKYIRKEFKCWRSEIALEFAIKDYNDGDRYYDEVIAIWNMIMEIYRDRYGDYSIFDLFDCNDEDYNDDESDLDDIDYDEIDEDENNWIDEYDQIAYYLYTQLTFDQIGELINALYLDGKYKLTHYGTQLMGADFDNKERIKILNATSELDDKYDIEDFDIIYVNNHENDEDKGFYISPMDISQKIKMNYQKLPSNIKKLVPLKKDWVVITDCWPNAKG